MKRPIVKDYLTTRMYLNDLERYCDELEKAFDKACGLLSVLLPNDIDFIENKDVGNFNGLEIPIYKIYRDKEKTKEWLLSEVSK